MKNHDKIKQYLCAVAFFCTVLSVSGQENTILDSFNAADNNGTVFLKWVISSGSTCDGINIFRSSDTIGFIQIGRIEGICGSPDTPQPFSFTDENPLKNQINYYRLELGYSGYSEIISIELISLNNRDHQVRPNPVVNGAKIYFENDESKPHILLVFDLNGRIIDEQSNSQAYFSINTSSLPGGLYLFSISGTESNQIIKGKFIKF